MRGLAMKRFWVFLLLTFGILQGAAHAESMTWRLRAFDKYAVDAAFYSQNRKHEWPGNNQVWTIKDYKVHEFKLNCIAGEKVCFGAWVRGNDKQYWGVGHHGRNKCTSCCYTCQQGFITPVQNLNE